MSLRSLLYAALFLFIGSAETNVDAARKPRSERTAFSKIKEKGNVHVFKYRVSSGEKDSDIALKFGIWDRGQGSLYETVTSASVTGDPSCKPQLLKKENIAYVCANRKLRVVPNDFKGPSIEFIDLFDTPYWGSLLKVTKSFGPDGFPVHTVDLNITAREKINVNSRRSAYAYRGSHDLESITIFAFDRDAERDLTLCPEKVYEFKYDELVTLPNCITDGSYGILAALEHFAKFEYGVLDKYTETVPPGLAGFKAGRLVKPSAELAPAPIIFITPPPSPTPLVPVPVSTIPAAPSGSSASSSATTTVPSPPISFKARRPGPGSAVPSVGSGISTIPAAPSGSSASSSATTTVPSPPISFKARRPGPGSAVPSVPASVSVFSGWTDTALGSSTESCSACASTNSVQFVGGVRVRGLLSNVEFNSNTGLESSYGFIGGDLRLVLGGGVGNNYLAVSAAAGLRKVGVDGLLSKRLLDFGDNSNTTHVEVGPSGRLHLAKGNKLEVDAVLNPAFLYSRERVNNFGGNSFLEEGKGLRINGSVALPRLLFNGEKFAWGLYGDFDLEALRLKQTNLNSGQETLFGWRTRGSYGGGSSFSFDALGTDVNIGVGFRTHHNYNLALRSNLSPNDLKWLQYRQQRGFILDLSDLTVGDSRGYTLDPALTIENDRFYLRLEGQVSIYGNVRRGGFCLNTGGKTRGGLYIGSGFCYSDITQESEAGSARSRGGSVNITLGSPSIKLNPRIDQADIR